MKYDYDVVIVGAGPIGNYAAWKIAEKGHSVAVLEKDREIGVPVRCGEAAGIKGLSMCLDEIDDRWVNSRINAAKIFSPSGIEITVPTGDDYGLVLDRKIFDKWIAKKASNFGADFHMKTYATELLFKDNVPVGVETVSFGQKKSFNAKVVIAADGVESKIARSYGINTVVGVAELEVCAQYFVSNIDIKSDTIHFYTGKEKAPGGYAWMFPKSGSTANIGLGINGIYAKEKSPVTYLNSFLQKHFPSAKILGSVVGSVPISKRQEEIVKDNFLIIGDAARQVSPLSGGGITYGLNAAKLAAQTVNKAFEANDFGKKFLSQYAREWDNLVGTQQIRAYRLKEAVRQIKDETLDKTAKKLSQEDSLSYTKVFKTLLINQPKLAITVIDMFLKS